MKKFIVFIITAIVLSSCGIPTITTKAIITETYGDIQLLNYEGQPIKVWKNAVMESETTTIVNGGVYTGPTSKTYALKEGGTINFKDEDGVYHLINGGIIVIDNLISKKRVKESEETRIKKQGEIDKENEIAKYEKISEELKDSEQELKKFRKNTKEYNETMAKVTNLRAKEKEQEKLLWSKYKYSVAKYN